MAIQITRIVVLVLISFKTCIGLEIKPLNYDRNIKICADQAKQPYFDIDVIIGKPWRIYYTWNVDMEAKCLDMIVKNATSSMVNRIYNDMSEYLVTQPEWDAATLYVSMGPYKHELLLFADQGAEGSFLGVPNVVKNGVIAPTRRAVPLLKFLIKLVHNSKYLLMMDCQIGVASLMSRQMPPYRSEIDSVAKRINIGEGLHACIADKKRDEQFGLK